MRTPICLMALFGLILSVQPSLALRFEQVGPLDKKRPVTPQPGWPAGVAPLMSHGSRVYSTGGNGVDQVYYQCEPGEIADLIKHYSGMRLRDHRLFIRIGEETIQTFKGDKISYNAYLWLPDAMGLFMMRRNGKAETFEPSLTIHVDAEADLAPFKKIAIPAHVVVDSAIAGWKPGKASLPKRDLWHAAVQFKDGKPAVDVEGNIWTKVTLWEEGEEHGFDLGQVTVEGTFNAAFSADEMGKFKAGKWWLTLSATNQMARARPTDFRLPLDQLVRDPAKAKPVRIGKPAFHYGRLLFVDGAPAFLDPKVWPGTEISINFPHAGMTTPDKDGYIKFFFTPEQFEDMKARQARKNIYIPDHLERNSKRALWVFPAKSLTMDKKTAGIVRIPRPPPPQWKKNG